MQSGTTFSQAIELATEALKQEGFGVLTEIDIKKTFKAKLDKEVGNYTILGACNPNYAYQALQEDSKMGVFLPCNVIVEELSGGQIEVSAVSPIDAMMAVKNKKIESYAKEIEKKVKQVIANL